MKNNKRNSYLFSLFFGLISFINIAQAETWAIHCARTYDTSLSKAEQVIPDPPRYQAGQVWARINYTGTYYNIETSFGDPDDDEALGGEGTKKMPVFMQHKADHGGWQMQNIGVNKWRVTGRLSSPAANHVHYVFDKMELDCSEWIREN